MAGAEARPIFTQVHGLLRLVLVDSSSASARIPGSRPSQVLLAPLLTHQGQQTPPLTLAAKSRPAGDTYVTQFQYILKCSH